MEQTSLLKLARPIELSVALPTNGKWYDEDFIKYNNLTEVDVMGMTGSDELLLLNPETLITGTAITSLISSCCPSISNPNRLYYPDVSTLLVAIKKASMGDKMIHSYLCPHCQKEIENIKLSAMEEVLKTHKSPDTDTDTDADADAEDEALIEEAKKIYEPIIDKKVKAKELMVTPNELEIDLSVYLDDIKPLPDECTYIDKKNNVKFYLSPNVFEDRIKYLNLTLKLNDAKLQVSNLVNKNLSSSSLTIENLSEISNTTKLYEEIGNLGNMLIASSIIQIELPDGSICNNKEEIAAYIKVSPSKLVSELRTLINELNSCGIQNTPIPLTCECCGKNWEETIQELNQLDFFTTFS